MAVLSVATPRSGQAPAILFGILISSRTFTGHAQSRRPLAAQPVQAQLPDEFMLATDDIMGSTHPMVQL
jgi:hypothetical protein